MLWCARGEGQMNVSYSSVHVSYSYSSNINIHSVLRHRTPANPLSEDSPCNIRNSLYGALQVLPYLIAKSSAADSCVFCCIVHFCLLAYQIFANSSSMHLPNHSRAYRTALTKFPGAFGLFCLVKFSDAASCSLVLVYILQRPTRQT